MTSFPAFLARADEGGADVVMTDVKVSDVTRVDQIAGPISLLQYESNQYKKKVYLFGEIHDMAPRCHAGSKIGIDQFIVNTVKATTQMIDVFLEIPHAAKEKEELSYHSRGAISDIYLKLQNCLYGRGGSMPCPVNNLRVHAVDIRQMRDENSKVAAITNMFFDINIMMNIDNDENRIRQAAAEYRLLAEKHLDIESYFGPRNDTDLDKPLSYKPFIEEKRVKKQIEDIKDDKVREAITTITQKPASITYRDILEAYKGAGDIVNARADRFRRVISKLSPIIAITFERLLYFISIIMDYYTISRIFRSFDGRPVSNAIIYVGEQHAWTYKSVFSALGFSLVNEAYSDKNFYPDQTLRLGTSWFSPAVQSCLDISKFQQPFFS